MCGHWVSKPEWAALFVLGRGICVTHLLRFTSGATPADLLGRQHGSQADLFYISVSRDWWGSKPGPIMSQMNALLIELYQLGFTHIFFYYGSIG